MLFSVFIFFINNTIDSCHLYPLYNWTKAFGVGELERIFSLPYFQRKNLCIQKSLYNPSQHKNMPLDELTPE